MRKTKMVLLTLLCALPLDAQEKFPFEWVRFELFNTCRPMWVDIDITGLSSNVAAIGLTEEDLHAAAESRLRSARLYSEKDSMMPVIRGEENLRRQITSVLDWRNRGGLSVEVVVEDRQFSMSVEFKKRLTDEFKNDTIATTWDRRIRRWHVMSGKKNYILQEFSQILDKFLTQYLRVNEAACESR